MNDQRLIAVYDAASYLFVKKGYDSTQVSQIAERANIGTGTVYNLFSGKKSILHFVLLSTFDKDYLQKDITLPFKEVEKSVIIDHLNRIIGEVFQKLEGGSDRGKKISFTEMLSVIFDYAASYQVAFNIINDNKSALEDAEEVYRASVSRLYKVIKEKLEDFIKQGEVREIEMLELHIRNILEGITWWSMYLPYQSPDRPLPVEKAREIAIDVLKHAYLVNPS